MKKKILSIVMITTALAFSGCRNAEREASSTKTGESISYSHEFDTDSNSHENLFAISYQIPLSWDCSNADNGNYYYPENGMLYVSTDASPFQVTKHDKQNNYIDGFSSEIDEFQELDRYTTDIAGVDALVFEFNGIISQEHVDGKSYVFTYGDLLYCFIYSDFITDGPYISHMKDFEEIINSISFPPLADEKSTKEAETNFSEKSDADTELHSENNTTDNEVLEDAADAVDTATSEAVADTTYQEILDEYTKKIQETTPGLVEEYNTEAASKSGDINALAEISNAKISKLAEIINEGIEEMASLMLKNGDEYSVYEEWAGKLTNVYMEQSQQITDAYMSSAVPQ